MSYHIVARELWQCSLASLAHRSHGCMVTGSAALPRDHRRSVYSPKVGCLHFEIPSLRHPQETLILRITTHTCALKFEQFLTMLLDEDLATVGRTSTQPSATMNLT